MKATRKLSAVQEAYVRCKPARDALIELDARCMEATEDKAGIVWERWIIQTPPGAVPKSSYVNVILFATPHWWDVFAPITKDQSIDGTLAALRQKMKEWEPL